ncbi:dihydroneopterin aldolase [Neobacillus notoginsengisoli]|uniref:7,8-dihydroneopterin aldolase n=1 Tax=Neobacillus notoginsengisoli TaxID=1578198 RepID=A0A417YG85_9BACI|nr:dihydroneopterin aldolase [Neobacillus notoginsengisoli]RHW31831.1 dihydroneopterin aldolase [Neobacillus notoginsengisoli]
MDKIYVNQMEFYGYHGVFPEETRLGQRFIIDLAVSLDLKEAGQTDNLDASVNYAELYNVCKEVVEGEPFKLIESVAEKIALRLLAEFPLIEETSVKVIKPDPPIPGHYKFVAAKITRRR